MSMRLLICIAGALSLLVPAWANATHSCWIDEVERSGEGLKVSLNMQPQHERPMLDGIKRRGGRIDSPPSGANSYNDSFYLDEGDLAHLEIGSHVWCTVLAMRKSDTLGVFVELSYQAHRQPLHTSSEFIESKNEK
jgi:hypothetical protein